MKFFIKVCGITSLKDASEVCSAGADAIGQGNKYMGDTGIHIDIALTGQSAGNLTKISSSAFWGGKSAKRSLAPAYLADIMTA
mgnify:CR=1 FL=1